MAAKKKKDVKDLKDLVTTYELTNDKTISLVRERISSGSLRVDAAMGWHYEEPNGGWPRGAVCEIYGPESSGKTSMASIVVANALRKYPHLNALFIDAEHAFDRAYAEEISGMEPGDERLYVQQPDSGDQALQLVEDACKTEAFSIIVVDSVAALMPQAEIDGDIGDQNVALRARLLSQAMPKINKAAKESKTLVLFINQIRSKIGGMSFGPQSDTTGGRALKFYAKIRVNIARIGAVKSGDVITGNKTLIKCDKNKTAPPYRKAEFNLIYNQGLDPMGELLDIGLDQKVVKKKAGGWFVFTEGEGADKKTVQLRAAEAAEALNGEWSHLRDRIYNQFMVDSVVAPDPEGGVEEDEEDAE